MIFSVDQWNFQEIKFLDCILQVNIPIEIIRRPCMERCSVVYEKHDELQMHSLVQSMTFQFLRTSLCLSISCI